MQHQEAPSKNCCKLSCQDFHIYIPVRVLFYSNHSEKKRHDKWQDVDTWVWRLQGIIHDLLLRPAPPLHIQHHPTRTNGKFDVAKTVMLQRKGSEIIDNRWLCFTVLPLKSCCSVFWSLVWYHKIVLFCPVFRIGVYSNVTFSQKIHPNSISPNLWVPPLLAETTTCHHDLFFPAQQHCSPWPLRWQPMSLIKPGSLREHPKCLQNPTIFTSQKVAFCMDFWWFFPPDFPRAQFEVSCLHCPKRGGEGFQCAVQVPNPLKSANFDMAKKGRFMFRYIFFFHSFEDKKLLCP